MSDGINQVVIGKDTYTHQALTRWSQDKMAAILQIMFVVEKSFILIQISLKLVCGFQIDIMSVLV